MPKLLVVDDEPAVVDLFQGVFEKRGIDVVGVASAGQAVSAATRAQPDVAVLDVLLPDGSGLDVFRELQQLDAKLPVIVMTASGGSDTVIEAMGLGALDGWIESSLSAGSQTLYDDVIADVDRRIISRVLQYCGDSQSEAAKILGMSRTTLRAKIEKLGIQIGRVVQSGP